ncbi:MFS transporter [Bacillus timonensis]|nr:MFS transporter [Bacillus timonensis]
MSDVQIKSLNEIKSHEKVEQNVFKNKNYLLLLITTLFSAPGYYVFLMGSEWLMLSITESRFFFGMLFMGAAIPRLIFMMYGGIIADRFNKKNILFLSDLTRAVLIGLLLLLVLLNQVQPWHLVAIAILMGVSDAFSHPASSSLITELLPKEMLQRGNSLLQMVNQISPILGPVLGGSLIYLIGFDGVFSVALIMLLLASATVCMISVKNKETGQQVSQLFQEFKDGLAYAKGNSILLSIMTLSFFINFLITGPLVMGIPLIVKDVFHENALGLTTLQVAIGVGSLLGALVMVILNNNKKPGLWSLSALVISTILFMLTGFSSSISTAAILLFLLGAALQVVNIPIMTIIQAQTDPKMMGRVMSLMMTMATGLIPVSFFVTSLLLGFGISITTIMKIGGLAVFVVALLGFMIKDLRNIQYIQEKS